MTEQHHFEMHITKATIDENGRMKWAATASDTSLDVFGEQMSLELYQDFVNKFPLKVDKPFVSLSHYPRLNGKGEAGVVDKIYIDKNMLKATGYFYDNPLGRAVYESIRQDRKDNLPYDRRVRVSIGFYDHQHKHGDYVWKIDQGIFCEKCAIGEKNKVYLSGDLDHLAVTRIPANQKTEIILRSEGENMTTRAEDAASIVPEEMVDEIEKEAKGLPIIKSANGQLVERAEVATSTIDGITEPVLKKILYKMLEDGTVTEDKLSQLLNEMVNAMTSQSQAVNTTGNIPVEVVEINKDATETKKAEDNKENPPAAQKSEVSAEKAISENGETAEIIEEACAPGKKKEKMMGEDGGEMEDDDMEEDKKETEDLGAAIALAVKPIVDAVNALADKLDGLQRTASVAEPENKSAEADTPPAWKAIVLETESVLEEAVKKSGSERQMAMQGAIDIFGQKLFALHTEMLTAEQQPVVNQSQAVNVDIGEVVQKAVAEKTGELTAKIDALTRIIENSVAANKIVQNKSASVTPNNSGFQVKPVQQSAAVSPMPVPQPKGLMAQAPAPVQRSSNGMSIAEIVRRTTFVK